MSVIIPLIAINNLQFLLISAEDYIFIMDVNVIKIKFLILSVS